VDDIMLMMHLSRDWDIYLTKSSRLEILTYVGIESAEVARLGSDCWELRKDAYRSLAKIYDSGGDENFIRFWAEKYGWSFEQLSKQSLRTWLCKNDAADLADPSKPGGPADYSDPSPVHSEHVKNLMRSNFPEDAIDWVDRARWVGPVQVPWERIDKDDIDSWAASKQPSAVNRFAKDIKAGTGHTNPSVLIQDNDSPKAIIIDGHHRALAHHKLGQPVLSYLGQIDPADRQAAEETHSKQVHSGTDPGNR
jgi:hypothetical protein